MPSVSILNGVNLGTLGTRRPEIYGNMTLDDIERLVGEAFPDLNLNFRQTDFEGEMVRFIWDAADSDGLVVNAGAWTHYSIAVRDAAAQLTAPLIELHISNVHKREEFRHHSVLSDIATAVIAGLGVDGYPLALRWLATHAG